MLWCPVFIFFLHSSYFVFFHSITKLCQFVLFFYTQIKYTQRVMFLCTTFVKFYTHARFYDINTCENIYVCDCVCIYLYTSYVTMCSLTDGVIIVCKRLQSRLNRLCEFQSLWRIPVENLRAAQCHAYVTLIRLTNFTSGRKLGCKQTAYFTHSSECLQGVWVGNRAACLHPRFHRYENWQLDWTRWNYRCSFYQSIEW